MALVFAPIPSAPLGVGLALQPLPSLQPPEEEPFTLLESPPDPLLAELYPPPPGENPFESALDLSAVPTTARTQSTLTTLPPMLSPPCVTPSPRSARAARTARASPLIAHGGTGGMPIAPQIDYKAIQRAFERLRTTSASLETKTRGVGRIALRVTKNSSSASPVISPKQSTSHITQAHPVPLLNGDGIPNGGVSDNGGDSNGNGNKAPSVNGMLSSPPPKRFLREIKTVEGSRQERIARISKMLNQIVQAGDVDQLIEGFEMYSDTEDYPLNFANARVLGEPLLVTAIKHHQRLVARELLQRGADAFQNVRTVDLNRRSASIDVFYTTPRELAYQHGMYELVDQMDAMERGALLADPTLASSHRVSWLYRHPESPLGTRVVRPPAFEATSAHSEPLNPYLQRYHKRLPLHSVKSYSTLPSLPTHLLARAQLGHSRTSGTSYSSPVDEPLSTSRSNATSSFDSVARHTGTKSRTMRHSSRE